MIVDADWSEEDTEVAPDAEVKRALMANEPSYELIWVEEDGIGMVLRVRRVTRHAD